MWVRVFKYIRLLGFRIGFFFSLIIFFFGWVYGFFFFNCADVENCGSFRGFGFIYIYILIMRINYIMSIYFGIAINLNVIMFLNIVLLLY